MNPPPRVDYHAYINSETWRLKRIEAFKFHGKKCAVCQSIRRLHVHHLNYFRFGGGELMEDLQVLCEPCHREQHGMKPINYRRIKKKRKKTRAPQFTHRDWLNRQKAARLNIERHRNTDAFIPSNAPL